MASKSLLLMLFAALVTTGVVEVSSQPPPPAPPPLRLANVYGDHMVLQQAPARANVWGYVEQCDSKITATFNGKTYDVTTYPDKMGRCVWLLTLPPVVADNKTYSIAITSSKYGKTELSDVLFGDVWMCGGQSNMQFTVSQAYNSADEIEDADNYPLIRLFTAAQRDSTKPQSELLSLTQEWAVANRKSIGGEDWKYFSASCWFFGRELFKHVKYPLGLVSSNYGGTPIEAWSSPDALSKCKTEVKGSPVNSSKLGDKNSPSVLWNAMILPFINMTVKGAVWYQGESNAGKPDSYNCTFPAMIDDWREKWYEGSHNQTTPLFFGFVQLAPYGDTNTTVGGYPVIRWAQTAGYGYVPNPRMKNVFMAVAIDLGDPKSPYGSVHPRDKQDVGTRLATGAKVMVYNSTKAYYLGMLPQSAKLSTTKVSGVTAIAVTYGNDNRGKLEMRYPYGFEVGCADSAGKTATQWKEGTAKSITDMDVNVEFPPCPKGLEARHIRYCWRQDPCSFSKCPIYSSFETPTPPFMLDLE